MPIGMPRSHPEAESRKLACGTCQWFNSGFQNKTCRVTREVVVDTVACVEYTERMPDLFYNLLQDKYFQGIREELRHNRFKLNESILTEIRGYILNNDFQNFRYGSKQELESVAKALLQIVGYRARVSTIHTSLIDMEHDLEELLSHVWLWMYAKHPMVKELKNDTMRKAALDRVLPEVMPIKRNLYKALALAKYVDERLDKNEWTLRTVLESAGKLVYSREGLNQL